MVCWIPCCTDPINCITVLQHLQQVGFKHSSDAPTDFQGSSTRKIKEF